jgi:hypothetical protein
MPLSSSSAPASAARQASAQVLRAVAPSDVAGQCAYCGALSLKPAKSGAAVCACGAHNSVVSARERLQQQMAG